MKLVSWLAKPLQFIAKPNSKYTSKNDVNEDVSVVFFISRSGGNIHDQIILFNADEKFSYSIKNLSFDYSQGINKIEK